jgi:hypothetical protein
MYFGNEKGSLKRTIASIQSQFEKFVRTCGAVKVGGIIGCQPTMRRIHDEQRNPAGLPVAQ